jgi:ubiquinone/menaquinone biosynthesis C-methylase UbiE
VTEVAAANEEALRAWNGVLFDRFVQYEHLVVGGLAPHGERALALHPPDAGSSVLDIGCGFGDMSQAIARIVGPTGRVLGVDVAPRFIERAREDAQRAGLGNARFDVADAQVASFGETFDYAYSRFGTMFFANPVAALRNIRRALAPAGRICFVTWRRREDNQWLYRAEQVVKPLVEVPEETDEARCGPGPYSMANADTVSHILLLAGFEEIGFERCDHPYRIGRDLDEAVEFNMALGPAGEAIRLAGAAADELRPRLAELLRGALADLATPDGVIAGSSTWVVSARAPA